jgi:TPR repeat protein
MGFLYEQGLSVDKNLKASFDHYLKASELGHVKATTKLAHFYYSGVRVEQPRCDEEALSTSHSDEEANFLVQPD